MGSAADSMGDSEMRFSEYFKLGRKQPTLDFVDIDVVGDVRVFLSPRALRLLPSEWADECIFQIQSFFKTVLHLIRKGKNTEAEELLAVLREPNETHLGLSEGDAQGRALGDQSAHWVWEALSNSEAVKTGLLQDLEDTILLIPGISVDIISDMTTNLIRGQLIAYTQDRCTYHGVAMEEVDSGPIWDPINKRWISRYEQLPLGPNGKLLLIPKAIVRKTFEYDPAKFYRYYVLETLRGIELAANSELVQLLKNKKRRVTIKSLKEKYGTGKAALIRETMKRPELLQRYRSDNERIQPPLSHRMIAAIEGTAAPDWQALLKNVISIKTGKAYADDYEKAVEGLLSAMFYPLLTNPQVQHKIHNGRKRIDITYTNVASTGFFSWLSKHYPAAHVFVECKNYGAEIGNPEIDQLSGRFSPSRGKFGLLVCRSLSDRNTLTVQDTARDDRGYIVVLDDSDLKELAEARSDDFSFHELPVFKKRFNALIM
jgi:hypothetical protein